MNRILLLVFVLCSGILISFQDMVFTISSTISIPDNWPKPIFNFADNPLTEEGFQLGRELFYDPSLSGDKTISCASCHLQFTGFTHVDHNVSHGIGGRKGTRNAPALINLAWNSSFHWDGGVNHLEVQPTNPIQHSAEMDNTLENVLFYLKASTKYRQLFFAAFGDSLIDSKRMLKAFAQFNVSLISSNSKYDQYIRKEIAFTSQENNGLKIFRKHCASCHTEPLFNSNKFASNGLKMDTAFNDVGRYAITHLYEDSLQFRIPTLRNIEHTFPYMHDGRYRKLKEVIDLYTESIDIDGNYLSPELRRKISLNSDEKKDLIAFLYTLTDKEFLYNPRFGFPR